MDHEEGEHACEQHIHEEPDVVESRIQLAVACVGVRLILHKAQVRALVTLAAGYDEVGLVDRRTRVRRGIDLVSTMAIPAASRFNITAE